MKYFLLIVIISTTVMASEADSLLIKGTVPSTVEININQFQLDQFSKQAVKSNASTSNYTIREVLNKNNQYIEVIIH